MTDYQLVIPTHQRAHKQTTLEQLPPAIRATTLVITSTAEDVLEIQQRYSHPARMIMVANGVATIAQKRHWIMQHVKAKFIFMMDDDMTFFARCPLAYRQYQGGWKLKAKAPAGTFTLNKATPADWSTFLQALGKLPAAAVGMSSRMGNDRQQESWAVNTRLMHAFGVSREIYKKLRLNFAEVQCREDMNVALRLLRAGYSNTVYFDMCCSPGSYGAPGGCSNERTVESSNASAEHFASLHPGLVRVVQKLYKGSTHRKEVVVAWKKTYATRAGAL